METFTYEFSTFEALEKSVNASICDTPQLLIQVFSASSSKDEVTKLQRYFSTKYPHSHLIGTTTDGIIHDANLVKEGKSVVTFTLFQKTHLRSSLLQSVDFYDSRELGVALAKELIQDDTKVIISFADGIFTNGEEYVHGVGSVNSDIILSGGLASDNGKLKQTYVFHQDGVIGEGAVGVSLSSKELNASVHYTFDWTPIGKKMLVTKAVKNRVYEIDGIPATEVYAKYLGHEIAKLLPRIGIEYPLIFEKNGVEVGRAVLLKHDDGSLTFAGNIPEGTSVRFGVGSVEKILRNSDYHTRCILDAMEYKPEVLFIYSCMARRRFIDKHIHEELNNFSKIGAVSGFFTNGEFFHSKQENQLLNETLTILILSENKNRLTSKLLDQEEKKYQTGVEAQHVIAHLANSVSKELEELNDSLERRIQESSEYIYKQAYYDKLTGLPNRLMLLNNLHQNIGKVLYLFNIDEFSMLNDFYGHAIGDKVLKQLAELLQNFTKEREVELFKLPSDEFVVVMDVNHNALSIEKTIQDCTSIIEDGALLKAKDYEIHIRVTIAAAIIKMGASTLSNVDMALKVAKKSGKNFMIYSEDLELVKECEANIKIANRIREAIKSDNIVPYFQPLYNFKTKKIEKYESLVRLVQNDSTVLAPFFFLEASQKIKLYSKITMIMIEKSFRYFAQRRDMAFSINLSFSDIFDEKMKRYLFDKIQEYDIASQLTIEILETQESEDMSLVNEFIDKVYAVGANIAIDDFGSGFANFEYMTTMRSDFMKIDGSLIKNIDKDKNARLVVETIIVFARKLHKSIVAEYVSSKEIFDIVKELGVDYAQGYYIGKPAPDIL